MEIVIDGEKLEKAIKSKDPKAIHGLILEIISSAKTAPSVPDPKPRQEVDQPATIPTEARLRLIIMKLAVIAMELAVTSRNTEVLAEIKKIVEKEAISSLNL